MKPEITHRIITGKPWGHEALVAHTEKYAGKILKIEFGESLSLQHHVVKEETIYVISGILGLNVGETVEEALAQYIELSVGEIINIKPGTIHRFSAPKGEVSLFEVSTPELEDVVRHVDNYGRV